MPTRKGATARKTPVRHRPKAAPVTLDEARPLALLAVEAGLDKKAEQPTILDVRGLASYADYVVLLSADNERQIDAIGREVEERIEKAGSRALGSEGSGETGWRLVDFGDVVVHLFTPEARAFYDLEGLWSDAPRVRA